MFTLNAGMIEHEVHIAGEVILSGGIILYPTDTIWGIGCDATKPESIQRIYHMKQRSDSKSMLVLVNSLVMLEEYIEGIPLEALKLIKESEKPTTIIYPAARKLAKNLVASDGSIGVRLTLDPFCQQLIAFTDRPLVSTSANYSGAPSPGIFQQIDASILEQVDHVVNWRQDETRPSKPSAIIKLDKYGNLTTLRS